MSVFAVLYHVYCLPMSLIDTVEKVLLRGGEKGQKETLPTALRTQALTALTNSFGLVWWGGFGMLGSLGLLG